MHSDNVEAASLSISLQMFFQARCSKISISCEKFGINPSRGWCFAYVGALCCGICRHVIRKRRFQPVFPLSACVRIAPFQTVGTIQSNQTGSDISLANLKATSCFAMMMDEFGEAKVVKAFGLNIVTVGVLCQASGDCTELEALLFALC